MNIIKKLSKQNKKYFSRHLLEKSRAFIEIRLFGIKYFIPLTLDMIKSFSLETKNGNYQFKNYKNGQRIDEILRDITSSLYLQVRDTVGAEIESKLSQQLNDGINKLFGNTIQNKINSEFDDKIPLIGHGKDVD